MADETNPRRAPELDLTRPRTVGEIIATAVFLYRAEGLTLLALTAIVVLPYQLITLLLANSAINGSGSALGAVLVVELIGVAVIVPLVSALQMQAVVLTAEGERPRVGSVFAHTLPALPQVAAAVIIAALGIALGFVCLIIPGIVLALRWAVVAQTAAFERTNWPTSLRRGASLTHRNYLRILGLGLAIAGIYLLLDVVVGIFAAAGQGVGDVVAILIALVMSSFGALCMAILYFDLRVREEASSSAPLGGAL